MRALHCFLLQVFAFGSASQLLSEQNHLGGRSSADTPGGSVTHLEHTNRSALCSRARARAPVYLSQLSHWIQFTISVGGESGASFD